MRFHPALFNQGGAPAPSYDDAIAETSPVYYASLDSVESVAWPDYESAVSESVYITRGSDWVIAWIAESDLTYPSLSDYLSDDVYADLGPDFHQAFHDQAGWGEYDAMIVAQTNLTPVWYTPAEEKVEVV